MSTGFKSGDLLDVTISARVVEIVPGGAIRLTFRQPEHLRASPMPLVLPLNSPDIGYERVAPAEWPPVAGDLWRDGHGDVWFAYTVHPDGTLRMVTANGLRWSDGHDGQLEDNAPWTLVHREGSAAPDVEHRCTSRIAEESGAVLRCFLYRGHNVPLSSIGAGMHLAGGVKWADDDDRVLSDDGGEQP
jgi:hypothetical protein